MSRVIDSDTSGKEKYSLCLIRTCPSPAHQTPSDRHIHQYSSLRLRFNSGIFPAYTADADLLTQPDVNVLVCCNHDSWIQ